MAVLKHKIDGAWQPVNGLPDALSGSTDPTTSTVALYVGQHYLNTTSNIEFTCTAINNGTYTWAVAKGVDNRLPSTIGTNGQMLKSNGTGIEWFSPEYHYFAIYNTTTFAEVTAALNAGKICFVNYVEDGTTYIYQLTRRSSSTYYFTAFYDGVYSGECSLNDDDEWDFSSEHLAISSDVTAKEDKGYLTLNGTHYPIRTSTTDAGETGYITFVIQT